MNSVALVNQGQLESFYDARYAGDYMTEHPSAEQHRVRDLLNDVPRSVNAVLDYGCGQGAWFELLGSQFPDAQITGIDISEHAIDKARLRCPTARLLAFEGGHAPLDPESFDLVFSYHVLEHVWDIDVTVGDMARLVKEGGYVCAIFPCGNSGSFEERVVRLVRNGVERSATRERRFYCDDPGHMRRMTTEEIVHRFAAHGLTPVRELFGNQRWGSIDWIAHERHAMVRQMFNPARAVDQRAKMKLRALRLGFLLLTPAVRLGSADELTARVRSSTTLRSRLLFTIAVMVKPLTAPISDSLGRAAATEWRKHRRDPAAALHYLLFRRGGAQ